ncbi:hypothetical protein M9M90_00620 [Phenylobacterium sp. LH3H17]|uniref:hypothetical protein n=1 Tax=Phenylobacterium sp. LH3H17 TaxID=2903901 RepID=UPI0020CA11E4|nr:hypothetical protein [Phenylobacterium sp. LH3H17]UTP39714.1 hypothetical protein M9M90_00620 [Phenylobacterium sp. LH3H17]
MAGSHRAWAWPSAAIWPALWAAASRPAAAEDNDVDQLALKTLLIANTMNHQRAE